MGRTNLGRVILGGLVAGIVLNIGEWILNGVLIKDQWDAAMTDLGKPVTSGSDIAVYVILTFVLGIVLVWLYAAMRPRYGPGPKTAILAGFVGWILADLFFWVSNWVSGVFPGGMITTMVIWEFFELPIGTLVGAWLYKEEDARAASPAMP